MLTQTRQVKRFVLLDLDRFGLDQHGYWTGLYFSKYDEQATFYATEEEADRQRGRALQPHISACVVVM